VFLFISNPFCLPDIGNGPPESKGSAAGRLGQIN